jgi:hypothetical protein
MNWKKTGRWIALVLGIVSITAIGLFLGSGVLLLRALGDAMCGEEELGRITSPDGKVDAFIVRGSCGATSPFTYKVYMVPKGEKANENTTEVFFAAHGDVQIHWAGHDLQIDYDKHAETISFRNRWTNPKRPEEYNIPYNVKIAEWQSLPPAN